MQRMPTPQPEALVLGDRYVVSGLLGRGAVGDVLAAHDTVLRREVAVKVWRAVGADEHALERVAREARAAGRVEAPTVVTVLDADVRSSPPYLVMERLSGLTWADAVRDAVPDDATSTAVLVDVLAALAAAHAVGVVHRDVKPANVVLTDDGRAKLGDFGIAALVDASRLTGTGDVLGSAPYLAPERLEGASASAACDVWSVGVMAYEAYTGQRPYAGDTPVLTAMAVLRGGHPPLAQVRPDLPPAVVAAVDAALSRDPANRPTPSAFRQVLEATLPPGDGTGDPMLSRFVASGGGPVAPADVAAPDGPASVSPGATVLVSLPVVSGPPSLPLPAQARSSAGRTARRPALILRAAALAAALLGVAGAGGAVAAWLDDAPRSASASSGQASGSPVRPATTAGSATSSASSAPAPTSVSPATVTRVRTRVVRSVVTTTTATARAKGPAAPKGGPGAGNGTVDASGKGAGKGNNGNSGGNGNGTDNGGSNGGGNGKGRGKAG